ncbi:MAG: helix-turn-helix transcriptional regulator [Pseudonocardiales bacterium]|nr:helix-turn-helix transcriptional regulator [Pseudonocardiales bacterium]
MPSSPSSSRALTGLAARLRAVREQAGLSGTELAEALGIGWLQPKVSKIETGRQLPTAEDIMAWARATGVDAEPLLTLRAKAAAEYVTYKDRIADAGGAVPRQHELAALAGSCTFLSEYQPALIPGRLQTPAYMRGMAEGVEFLAADGIPTDQIGHLIAARLRRQAIMYEPGREIVHVVGEAALRTRIGGMSVATLRAQLTYLAEMSELPGHTFGVVPFSVVTPFTPLSGWSMYDRDLVVIETRDGTIQLTEPAVLARYARWLDQLLAVALTGSDAAEFCHAVSASLTDD